MCTSGRAITPGRACASALASFVAVAIEMDELPACDLPGAVRGDGDQGVAAGVIADRSRIGGTIHAEGRRSVSSGSVPSSSPSPLRSAAWPHNLCRHI